jgi:hypothetical protein
MERSWLVNLYIINDKYKENVPLPVFRPRKEM